MRPPSPYSTNIPTAVKTGKVREVTRPTGRLKQAHRVIYRLQTTHIVLDGSQAEEEQLLSQAISCTSQSSPGDVVEYFCLTCSSVVCDDGTLGFIHPVE